MTRAEIARRFLNGTYGESAEQSNDGNRTASREPVTSMPAGPGLLGTS